MAKIAKQMEMFELGGLKDQGETVDRKSRNKVPVGSLKKEVRDDYEYETRCKSRTRHDE